MWHWKLGKWTKFLHCLLLVCLSKYQDYFYDNPIISRIDLLTASLEQIFPLFFALNHINHARWVSVFTRDLKLLPLKMPELYQEFRNGYFVVNTPIFQDSNRPCPRTEHKTIKSSSGYIDPVNVEHKIIIHKVELCCPVLTNI